MHGKLCCLQPVPELLVFMSVETRPNSFLFVSTEQGAKTRTHPSPQTKNGDKHHRGEFLPGHRAVSDGLRVAPALPAPGDRGPHRPEDPAQRLRARRRAQGGLHAPHENPTVRTADAGGPSREPGLGARRPLAQPLLSQPLERATQCISVSWIASGRRPNPN